MTFEELEQIRIKYKNKSLLAFGIAICIVLATLLVLCINKLYDIIPAAFIFTFFVWHLTKYIESTKMNKCMVANNHKGG